MKKIAEMVELIDNCKKSGMSDSDIALIEKAAIFAYEKHDGQLRKSGEPYIIHPIYTAKILLEWKMDVQTIVTGLLHDVLEDTNTTEQEIKKEFGDEIFKLVNYVTKVNLFSKENRSSKENKDDNNYTIQVFLSMATDVRAMIVKLADRYHNMMTINFLPKEKQIRIATETLNIYAQVAGRLGMYRLKTNMLDMSFAVLNPEAYKETKNEIEAIEKKYHHTWQETTSQIKEILDSYSVEYEIKSRIKGFYSSYEKTLRGYNIKDIRDIYAIRIITTNNLDCYTILGLIHLNFTIINKAFKDYISMPKFNYYQSIHTTIVKNEALIEIQIRTDKMDLLAENGIAAHWNYKNTGDTQRLLKNNHFIEEIKNLSDTSLTNITEITNDIVFSVTVLNNGIVYTVNNKTRCIDLAYRVDSDKFKYLSAISVNGSIVNFDYLIQPHDTIKFNYADEVKINKKWLKYTTFARTTSAIKTILSQEKDNEFINEEDFFKKVKTILKDNYIGDNEALKRIKKRLGVKTISEFLNLITPEIYGDENFFKLFDKRKQISRLSLNKLSQKAIVSIKQKKEFYFDKIDGLYFSDLQFPKCCNKVPGMNVIGRLERDNILQVHDVNCKSLQKKSKWNKIYPLNWNENSLMTQPRKFRYAFNFSAIWTPSIGNIVCMKLKKFNNLINEVIVKKQKETTDCEINIIVYTPHINSIKAAFAELSQEINIKSHLTF